MKTITFPIYVDITPPTYEWEEGENIVNGLKFRVRDWLSTSKEYRCVHTQTITVEIPDDINPTRLHIEKLERERQELLADTQVKVNRINNAISKLQALTNEVSA